MDIWEIKMVHKMTLWGRLNGSIDYLVMKYGTMVDNAKTMSEKMEIEREFKVTMACHNIVVD